MSKKAFMLVAGSVVALAIGKHFNVGLVLDVPLLSITFILITKHRRSIAAWFKQLPVPGAILWLVSTLPFMLFEENINCLPTGCRLIPPTIPLLLGLVLAFGMIVKFLKIKSFKIPVAIFSIAGFFIESTYGVAAAQFRALPPQWLIFFTIWIALSYAYLVIIPTEILIEDRARDSLEPQA